VGVPTFSEKLFTASFGQLIHTKTMKRGFKHTDLPTTHLSEDYSYRPELTRDPIEAARRRSHPNGNVILEEQASGIYVAHALFTHDMPEPADRLFRNKWMARGFLNAAYHLFAEDESEVMRRRLLLAQLADDQSGWRETRKGLEFKLDHQIGHAALLADSLLIAHQNERDTTKLKMKLGATMGNIAIGLESLQLVDAPHGMSEYDIQSVVRWTALDMIKDARLSHREVGRTASIAQLSLPSTPLSTYWSRRAPATNQAFHGLEQAQRDYGLAQ
jgi:hypothetical protein